MLDKNDVVLIYFNHKIILMKNGNQEDIFYAVATVYKTINSQL